MDISTTRYFPFTTTALTLVYRFPLINKSSHIGSKMSGQDNITPEYGSAA